MANVEGRGIIARGRNGMKVAAGIDVSKGHLEVSVSAGKVKRFVNDEEGVKALAWWLARAGVNIVVCESTGGYERSVVEGLEDSGILVWVAHPLRVRALAQAYGQEAKTDALDAQMLSRYGEMFEPEDVHRLSESEQSLREVIRRREQLVSQRVQEKNRLEKGLRGMARESTERHIEWLDEEIERLEAARGALLRHDAELLERAKLYSSVSGVGEHTAGVLLTHLPELGKCSGKALAALVGLAPWSKDSGRKRGHRVIRGGRGAVRRALYMSALSAVRRAGQMRSFYERLRSKGKPFKVALVAVMRKMLLQLNSVARRGTPWVENYAPAAQNP